MNRRGRKAGGRRSAGSGWRRSRLAGLVAALSLLVQILASASPAPAFARGDEAAAAAALKAMFGDAAEFCVHPEDRGAPCKHAPRGDCCDQCPLCRFAAQAVAFVPPDLAALPERLDSGARAIRAPPGKDSLPACAARANPARAPPLAV